MEIEPDLGWNLDFVVVRGERDVLHCVKLHNFSSKMCQKEWRVGVVSSSRAAHSIHILEGITERAAQHNTDDN